MYVYVDVGKGAEAFTSGFEGSWTRRPTEWGNDYFTNLVSDYVCGKYKMIR
jgi:catalase (peroxidase I)